MRMGMPKSPPAKDGLPSPPADGVISNADLPGSGAAGRPGVKRTKSLMQKLKTMVRTRSGSVESSQGGDGVAPVVIPGRAGRRGSGLGQRMDSMYGGGGYGAGGRGVVEEEQVVDDDHQEGDDRFADADEDVFVGRTVREGQYARAR